MIWNVTPYGLETSDESYSIEASRLTETTDRGRTYYDWPLHMAEKDWVDIAEFNTEFCAALVHHRMRTNQEMLEATCAKAVRMAARRDEVPPDIEVVGTASRLKVYRLRYRSGHPPNGQHPNNAE